MGLGNKGGNEICTICVCLIAAITTVVTIAEILKNTGLATEKSKNLFQILTSLPELEYADLILGIWFEQRF